MDNNSQFQLRESSLGSTSAPTVDPVDTNSGSGSGDNTTTTTTTTTTNTGTGSGDNGGGATVTTPTVTDNNAPTPEPITQPTPASEAYCAMCMAEKYANLAIRWGIVLVLIALSFNLIKQVGKAKA